MRTAIFPARFDQLDLIREFVIQAARDAMMDEDGICAVEMAVDEACSNIIEHAYKGVSDGEIECTCDCSGDSLTIMLRDHGPSFNMMVFPDPDVSLPLEDRRVGGLGIFLIRRLMDDVRYESRAELGNVLTLVRRVRRSG